ncbi:MAG: hypothetical protein M1834_008029 [Cirrosporium novae-zelandiae]|nr:MAG: hypothetical protein M1834_008029 [Cirrosporium novae-zelandiae]
MTTFISLLVILCATLPVWAYPTPDLKVIRAKAAALLLEERDDGPGVYMCTDVNWGGECYYQPGLATTGENACRQVPDNELNGDKSLVSSFGPDEGQTCTLYGNIFCTNTGEGTATVSSPGTGDLVAYGYNDKVFSYKCVAS